MDQMSLFGPVEPQKPMTITPPGLGTQLPEIILLDYVMTLVANSDDKSRHYYRQNGEYEAWIQREIYRGWLIDLFRQHPEVRVLLVTARHAKHEAATLHRLWEAGGGWMPEEAFFNTRGIEPPQCKQEIMARSIFPRFGTPDRRRYLALESNTSTRAMYAKLGVPAIRVPTVDSWNSLPLV